MSNRYVFSYQFTTLKFEVKEVADESRQEKGIGEVTLNFDHSVNEDNKSGRAEFLLKGLFIRGKDRPKVKDFEVLAKLSVEFKYEEEIPKECREGSSQFWVPLTRDLYLIAQDKLSSLAASSGYPGSLFTTPLPIEVTQGFGE